MTARAKRAAVGTIVFVHANGFPGPTYERLFTAWRKAGYRVVAPERLGHDPRYPVVSGWRPTRDELLALIEAEMPGAAASPLHLVGHSMGGYVSLLAAIKRPGIAAGVVLLDSPLIAGWVAHSLRALKATRLIDRLGPGRISKTRRMHWPSREDAHRHYAGKRAFARWHPDVLAAYIGAGLEDAPDGGVQLRFRREVETRYYRTVPHDLASRLRRHPLRCPVSYIGGTQSAEMRQTGLHATLALAGPRVQWIEGSHLMPMEQPDAVAEAVLRAIAAGTAAR